MDSLVESNVEVYLVNRWHLRPHDVGTVLFRMRTLAQVAGHALDRRFARAGLAAGPEAEIAAGIVDHATVGGGGATVPEHSIRNAVDRWLTKTPPKGRR